MDEQKFICAMFAMVIFRVFMKYWDKNDQMNITNFLPDFYPTHILLIIKPI